MLFVALMIEKIENCRIFAPSNFYKWVDFIKINSTKYLRKSTIFNDNIQ